MHALSGYEHCPYYIIYVRVRAATPVTDHAISPASGVAKKHLLANSTRCCSSVLSIGFNGTLLRYKIIKTVKIQSHLSHVPLFLHAPTQLFAALLILPHKLL